MQSKKTSLQESTTKAFWGYLTALVSQYLIFPLFSIHIDFISNITIALYFTIISIARSYLLRRYNNHRNVLNNTVQNKRESLHEQLENLTIGYCISVISQIVIFPYFDIHLSFYENLHVSLYFSVLSVLRGYIIRRLYCKKERAITLK